METYELDYDDALDAVERGYDVRDNEGNQVDADYINNNPDETYYN